MKTKTTTNSTNYIPVYGQNIFEAVTKRAVAKNQGSTIILPHVCNNIDLFGAGFAAEIAKHYPEVKSNYHLLGKNFLKSNLGHAQFIDVFVDKQYGHKITIVNMIAQNGIKSSSNNRPLNYAALCKSMITISRHIQMNTGFLSKNERVEIHAPKFGSGLAGGNWNFISDLIHDIWNKYPVFIYNFGK